jgi:hypothetical protein
LCKKLHTLRQATPAPKPVNSYNGFEWVEDEAGTVLRFTPMSPVVREALEQLRQAFIARHGREPAPDDPLFPDMPHPEHLEAMMVEDMKAAGLDPALIYAFEKTGLLVTEQNHGRPACSSRPARRGAAVATGLRGAA